MKRWSPVTPDGLRPGAAAGLLFLSGFCALVDQVAWFRLFRLSFGASTAATAAVLAIFMGGLGLGGALLGRRADRHRRPLALYGRLEVGITAGVAASPLLMTLSHGLYLAVGGSTALGTAGATVVRLILAALILAVPTFLMGGTLPAMARAVVRHEDHGRRGVALLYGANTVGAVVGTVVATFLALEHLGIRNTLWASAALNLLLALVALAWARSQDPDATAEDSPAAHTAAEPPGTEGATIDNGADAPGFRPAPTAFVLAAAALVGFVFFLLELVWYRMLAPLLGGSSYTFGLVLAVALAGVGLGGGLYALGRRRRRPTLSLFAVTCALEALAVAAPFALGDRLATLAMLLRPLGRVEFPLLVGSWTVITAVVVLPAALVAGYQFPLLVGILGAGRERLGRQVGLAYAWNTVGAMAGSLAGGFGLLPWLTAPGAWRLCALLLVALAVAALGVGLLPGRGSSPARRRRAQAGPAIATLALAILACLLLTTPGPTAFWRHSPIGAGAMPSRLAGDNDVESLRRTTHRAITWQREGVESSVAVHSLSEISFVINGKSDGTALRDAPTQVMSGLIGAALHPDPRRALVIGLGTGSSAGWLAEVPSMETVVAVELEAAILHVAELCAPVNHGVLEHPKVDIVLGDGREYLLTSDEQWDLIFSEPSNPYRAGIASLFSVELYRAAAESLGEDGLFLQWLQGYSVDSRVVRTAMATLREVFPYVESWQVHSEDLLLVASSSPVEHDVARVRRRVAGYPWADALRDVLGVAGAEGFYGGFVASSAFAAAVSREEAQQGRPVNTDDRPVLEFGFVRNLGRASAFDLDLMRSLARARGEGLPPAVEPRPRPDSLDLRRLEDWRMAREVAWGGEPILPATGEPALDTRIAARQAYTRGDLDRALELWRSQPETPLAPMDQVMVAELLAEAGDPAATELAARLEPWAPVTAAAVSGRLAWRRGDPATAGRRLAEAFVLAQVHPWTHRPLLDRALALAVTVARRDRQAGHRLYEALAEPFSVRLLDEIRRRSRLDVAAAVDFAGLCAEALAPFEPQAPWEEAFLRVREDCYRTVGDPRAALARAELERFLAQAPPRLVPPGEPGETASQNPALPEPRS